MYGDIFCKRLTQLRIEKGVSSRDMSLSIGQNESYINKIENGYSEPSMSGFYYICEYLKITPAEFWDISEEHPVEIHELIESVKKLKNREAIEHLNALVKDILNGQ